MAKYQGWTNYETWAVKLWMDNEQPSCDFWREQVVECWDEAKDEAHISRRENALYALADRLQEFHEDCAGYLLAQQKEPSFINDLCHAAMGKVNWIEIADALLEELVADIEREKNVS